MRLKKAFSILLLVALVGQTATNLLTYVNYRIHKAEIVATKCVERDQEVNDCQGTCQLSEQLSENNVDPENNGSRVPPIFEQINLTLFFPSTDRGRLCCNPTWERVADHYSTLCDQEYVTAVLKPPIQGSTSLLAPFS